ncbi:hypothetical protein [Acidicapsa ligni]|uniref:hypothetical protein n=1 Tax=Acidicapsa ligni TaxID=542300 RepID=UPI0021DFAD85|nr:hypothetical protein [Acidicapsa ligni]
MAVALALVLVLVLVLPGTVAQAFAIKHVTVEQLEKELDSIRGKSDSKIAHQLAGMELTERMNVSTLSRLESGLRGRQSRQALLLLADDAVFLDSPAAEVSTDPKPDAAARQKMADLMVAYVKKTISRFPNFFATRNTTWFADQPDTSFSGYESMHVIGNASETVLYRDGHEVVENANVTNKKASTGTRGVVTTGEYGPILITAIIDVAHGTMAWDRWEKIESPNLNSNPGGSTSQTLAVFRFSVPRDKSHYGVTVCCSEEGLGNKRFKRFPAYHGEIALDPETGAIFRLTMQADLEPSDLVVEADLIVEFEPVEIGGIAYVCPVRSVSISEEPMRDDSSRRPSYRNDGGYHSDAGKHGNAGTEGGLPNGRGRYQTFMSDVVFERYHLLRSESRMVIGNN